MVAQGSGRSSGLSDRIQKFFESQGIDNYGPVYTLDGKPLGATPGLTHEDHPDGWSARTLSQAWQQRIAPARRLFTEALWNTPIPSGQSRYYDGMLYLMSLMHASGEFRIVVPRK